MTRTKPISPKLPRVVPLRIVKDIEFKNQTFVKKVLEYRLRQIRNEGHVYCIGGRDISNHKEHHEITVVNLDIKCKMSHYVHADELVKTLPKEKLPELECITLSVLKSNQFKLDKLVEADIVEKDGSMYWYEGECIFPTDVYNQFRAETCEHLRSRCGLARSFAAPWKLDELLNEARSLDREQNELLNQRFTRHCYVNEGRFETFEIDG